MLHDSQIIPCFLLFSVLNDVQSRVMQFIQFRLKSVELYTNVTCYEVF